MQIPGFINTGHPGKKTCDSLRFNSTVRVQKGFELEDDLMDIATTLDAHPVVDYPPDMLKNPNIEPLDLVDRTWARLSGSSVWLPKQQVFFSVTRVIFTPVGTTIIKMSFLRGQLFDRDWNPLINYTLTWGDKQFTFPLVFNISAPWKVDGSYYGPEDPRVILEDVDGAEPVIVFNMISPESNWKRAMYVFRPFSTYSTILTIGDKPRQESEKNWAPFFVSEQIDQGRLRGLAASRDWRKPSDYIYFLYGFKPLRILKCHLHCGDCELVFDQTITEKSPIALHEHGGSLRGGTNFVPIPLLSTWGKFSNTQIYVAFSRTNIPGFCGGSFYRPELTIMIRQGTHFHLAYTSESLEFGNSLVDLGLADDRCGKGRILIPNSIAQWDVEGGQDVMTVTFSVDDKTVQVARIHGMLGLVQRLPPVQNLLRPGLLFRGEDVDVRDYALSLGGNEIRACLVESALNYTAAAYLITHPPEAPNPDQGELGARIMQEAKEAETQADM